MQKGLLMRKNGYKTSVKRIAAGVLAAAMFLSFTACGGTKEEKVEMEQLQ